ncbi:MAG: four-carbon acid sugar kinase family protein [Fibrobacteria bacterium]|nr:four-carbon acid sugar kinase family protein [Fibrobacteria bacterium]
MSDVTVPIVFYGDDFTGTTALGEALAESGTPTMIFTEVPDASFVKEKFPGVKAVGVAGVSRSIKTPDLELEVASVFKKLSEYNALLFLYKVCSTFDSSPDLGSIGRAMEIGKNVFNSRFIPVLPAAPKFGRYTLFGNHFAALGAGEVFRLDRHPSISKHPSTPMTEADLLQHLAKQTKLSQALIDLRTVNKGADAILTSIEKLREEKVDYGVIDCLRDEDIISGGNAIIEYARKYGQTFTVCSQELGYGISDALINKGIITSSQHDNTITEQAKGPVLVLSGSCGVMTGKQIEHARSNGFSDLSINPADILNPKNNESYRETLTEQALNLLDRGSSVVVHSACGPEDPRREQMTNAVDQLGIDMPQANHTLGQALGNIALDVIKKGKLQRLIVAGGDTSGEVQETLAIKALQVVKPIGIAAPLCYIYSGIDSVNGVEIAMKGGQAGAESYFTDALNLKTADFKDAALGSL